MPTVPDANPTSDRASTPDAAAAPSSAATAPPARSWSERDLAGNPHEAADKASRVQGMFAAIARAYDLNNRVHSMGRDQAWRRKTVRLCRIQPTDRVLDVACGTGDLTEALAAARPGAIRGVDFTPDMLEIARRKAARARRPKGIPEPEYRVGDAMALEEATASRDVITIAFGIRNVVEPEVALAEFHRVLAPGGRLAILEFAQPRARLVRAFSDLYTRRIMPITATIVARDRSGAYRYLPRSVATFHDAEDLAALVSRAGFRHVEVHRMDLGICACVLGSV